MTKPRAVITTDSGEDMKPELDQFCITIRLERAAPERYSVLLALQLFGATNSNQLNPAKVIREIEALEGIGEPSRLKPSTQFLHPPLKGLWHKHYLGEGVRPLAINLVKGLRTYGLPSLSDSIKKAKEAGKELYIEDVIGAITYEATHETYSRLAEDSKLTGDWLIYATHNGINYYLCIAKHDVRTHQETRNQIEALCCQEFPFLSELLSPIV